MKYCKFNKDNVTIEVVPEDYCGIYEIDLERCDDSAEILDFIYQIKHKTWCNETLMMELLECFDLACKEFQKESVQGTFCPLGCNRKVSWPKAIINK